MHRNDKKSLIFRIAPSDKQALLISRDQPIPHSQNVINSTVMSPLVAPKRKSRLSQIHHPHLPVASPVTCHVFIDNTKSLHFLGKRTKCRRAVESRISKTDVICVGDSDKRLLHAFETVNIAALGRLRCHLLCGEVVCDNFVVTSRDEPSALLHEVDRHDFSSEVEDCLLLEKQCHQIVSYIVFSHIEQLYIEIQAQSDHAEAVTRTAVFEQIEDIPIMQFLRNLKGLFTAERALCRIPETDTALKVSHKKVLSHNRKAIGAFGENSPHYFELIINVVDLYFALCLLPVSFVKEITAHELFFIQNCQFLHLKRGVLVGEVKVRPQFASVKRS